MAVDPKFEKFYNKAIEAGYSDDEIVAGWKKIKAAKAAKSTPREEGTMSKVLGTAAELGGEYVPSTMIAGGVEEGLKKLGIEVPLRETAKDYATSLLGGVGDVVAGGRESFNKYVQGDEQELAALNQDAAMRKQKLAEITQNSPVFSQIGSAVGQTLPLAVGGVAGAATKLPAALEAGLATKGGMAALGSMLGGLEGLTQSYTPEQEAAGDRESGVGWGTALGAAGSLAGPAIQGTKNLRKNFSNLMLRDENLKDFVVRTLRGSDASDTSAGLNKIRDIQNKYLGDKKQEFNDLYTANEKVLAKQVGDKMLLENNLFKPEELATKDVMEAIVASESGALPLLNKVSSRKSANLIDPTPDDNTIDFSTAAQAVRDLRGKASLLRESPERASSADQIENIANRIEGMINNNADLFPGIKTLQENNQGLNSRFGEEVVKLRDTGKDFSGRWGNWKAGGQERDVFDRDILPEADAWDSAEKAIPEAIPLMRERYGTQKLLSGTEQGKYLSNRDVRNKVWTSPEEQQHATLLADMFKDEPNMLDTLLQKYGRMPSVTAGPAIEMAIKGRLPYGVKKQTMDNAERVARALRGGVLGAAVLPYNEEPPPLVITRGR